MQFIIHFDLSGGSEDSVRVSGETIEEIQDKAAIELDKRGGTNPWSEEVS
ncbi:hypothetical protein LCGC14_0895880 [marine sediment metagenome]|uniref:Uncharacterized protein n=1 Tax=marine sediment metagenome TaxID=412755 RepID=A0A0F9P2Q4_9ZZZZ